jgi:hypothetical protein
MRAVLIAVLALSVAMPVPALAQALTFDRATVAPATPAPTRLPRGLSFRVDPPQRQVVVRRVPIARPAPPRPFALTTEHRGALAGGAVGAAFGALEGFAHPIDGSARTPSAVMGACIFGLLGAAIGHAFDR